MTKSTNLATNFNNEEKIYICKMEFFLTKRRENKYLKKYQSTGYTTLMPSSNLFLSPEYNQKILDDLKRKRDIEERQKAWDLINGIDREKQRQIAEKNAAQHGTVSQARNEKVVSPPMSLLELGKAMDAAIDEQRKEDNKYIRGYFLDNLVKSSNLGAGIDKAINNNTIGSKLLGVGQAALGTALLAGGANLVSPRNIGTNVVSQPVNQSYRLLNAKPSIANQIFKDLAIGTTGYEAVEQLNRPIDKIINGTDRTYSQTVNDYMFSKETQENHPMATDMAVALLNPGGYLGFGAKGLEYTGLFGKQLVNDISNGVNSAKNLFPQYTSRITPVTGKFEIVPEKNVGKDVAVRPVDFKSELDWNPENWFSKRIGEYGLPFDAHHNPKGYTENDIKSLQSHIPEYIEIERKTKADDTWLKMPDGSTWSGDPRSWVQLMSSDGQKLALQRLLTGVQRNEQYSFPTYTGNIWASDSKQFADYWAPDGKSFEISYPKTSKTVTYDAKDDFWTEMDIDGIPKDDFHNKVSNGVVKYGISQGNDIVKIKNIVESKRIPSLTDIYIRDGVPSKIIEGNNGNFDLSVLNKYRILIPFILPLINKNNEKNNNQN